MKNFTQLWEGAGILAWHEYFTGGLHWQDIVQGAPLLWGGLRNTILLAGITILTGSALGTLLAIVRNEKTPVLSHLAFLYVEFIRSIPLILFLVFIHYGILPRFIDRPGFFLSSVIAFALFESAYIAEIIRGGLASIHISQKESAKSLGLSFWQRYYHLFLPMAFRSAMPSLIGQFVSLIKDTSLAAIVGVIELTRAGEIIYERTFHDFEILLFLALVYWCMCFGVSQLGKRLEYRH